MRYLFISMVVWAVGTGCATPRMVAAPPVSEDVDPWKRRYEEERERVEALAVRVAELESALESQKQERAESVLLPPLWREELDRVRAERHSLVEHNAQLVTKQRELTAIQEELEDVWYQSALSRARRRSQSQQPPPGAPPPTAPLGAP